MRKDSGFSLGELITIMGILSVMAVIAMPSLLGSRSNANLRRASQDVYSTIQKTKSESVRRNLKCEVRFTASDFEISCPDPTPLSIKTEWTRYPGVIPPADSTLYFSSNGFSVNAGGELTGGSITLLNKRNKANTITVTAAGSISISRLN